MPLKSWYDIIPRLVKTPRPRRGHTGRSSAVARLHAGSGKDEICLAPSPLGAPGSTGMGHSESGLVNIPTTFGVGRPMGLNAAPARDTGPPQRDRVEHAA